MYVPKSPFVLGMEITTQCNLNCPHCLADADSRGKKIPYDKAISVIDEAERIGVKDLVLGGGEVLLYDEFFNLCEYALIKGLNVTFSSNGLLIPKEIDSISRLKKHNRMLRVGISLDGPTPKIHSYFRPEDTFEAAIRAISLLQNEDINVHVLCVLNKKNIKIIPDFLEFLIKLNISDMRLLPLMPFGRGKLHREEMLSPAEFYYILQEKNKWINEFKINIGLNMPWEFLFYPLNKRHPHPCVAGYLRFWKNSDGNMFPCAYMSDIPLGNIYTDSISDVWLNSPIMRNLRDPSLLKGACSTCAYRADCRGGCRGLAQFLEGDYLCADPYCPIANQKLLK